MGTLESVTSKFDVIVIGGGVTGAGIFRDLALHGVSTLLLEKGDFASQTSSRSSKMLHGGIRYLEQMDFALVHEALVEKNFWQKSASHLCYESPFVLPVYKGNKFPLWMIDIGLTLYDFLAQNQHTKHKILSKEETLLKIPDLDSKGLKGSGLYHDVIVDDIKLTLENIYDGLIEKNCEALNYTEVTNINFSNNQVFINARDVLTGIKKNFVCKKLVVAVGPFSDQVFKNLFPFNISDYLLPSKGIHLWLKRESIDINIPMVLKTSDERVIFIIPQKEMLLIGTTENEDIKQDFFNIQATKKEIDYLLKILNSYFPKANISNQDIISTFAGVRPLVRDPTKQATETSRHHLILRFHRDIYTILGGKLTTFRNMGREITEEIVASFGGQYNSRKTNAQLRQKSILPSFKNSKLTKEIVEEIIRYEKPRTIDDILYRRKGHCLDVLNKNFYDEEELFLSFREKLGDVRNILPPIRKSK